MILPRRKILLLLKNHLYIRSIHNEVRVRFAPSPTGYLHLGGLRTALYNFLFAKHHNGKFLLRIEDTDQTRTISGAKESIIEDLTWAGIEIDEGPGFGGKFGSYIQSERNQIYLKYVKKLLDNGTAYRCFCTDRRLDLLRKDALRSRQIPRYDNKCRHLTTNQINEHLENKAPFCIRFKLEKYDKSFMDLIYGSIEHDVSSNEGDPVIIKTDNFPTYHFANVVDDHLMEVTHVFRGVEWQISTTKHLLLYNAFGWNAPAYGHLPLLVNADGTKLSKRQGDIGIKNFRDRGYFPEAVNNYVLSAGGGFDIEQSNKGNLLSSNELIKAFNVDRINSSPSKLTSGLLDDLNRMAIVKRLENDESTEQMVKYIQNLLKTTYINQENLDLDYDHIKNVLKWSSKRLHCLKDLTSVEFSFLWVKPTPNNLQNINKDHVKKLLKLLTNIEYSKDVINAGLKDFSKQENIKFNFLMKLLRSLLSGLKEGPGVAEMMEILGKNVVLQRISDATKRV